MVKPVKSDELRSAMEIALDRYDLDYSGERGAGAAPALLESAGPSTRRAKAPGVRVVRHQLEKILASSDFDASRRSRDFLRFVVEETLAGRGEDLTQSAIAIQVFGRKDDFDALVDPIVRIQAGRLRRSLERYYLLGGKGAPVRIELRRGGYAPVFSAQTEKAPAPAEDRAPGPEASITLADEWPAVVVTPFESSPGGLAHEASAARVTEELVLELGRYREVRALLHPEPDQRETSARSRVRFSIRGRVWVEDGELRVVARLLDHSTGEQVWGDEYHTAPRPGRWSGPPDDIARVIAARVGAEEGVIVQLLAAERRKAKVASITPYGAILLSYEFFLARDPHSLSPALEALHDVVRAEPDRGPAWTRLARLYIANHTFEVTPIPTPIDQAITYAHHGVRVDPASRRARCILAAALLVKGELPSARDELQEALRLSPDSLVYLEIIGYFLTLLGDGTRGPALMRAARERNPHCLPNVSHGLWFDHLRRGEIEQAYQVALEHRDPTFFWRGVMRASCLGLLGRTADAAVEVADILASKPDFAERGRTLIGHYIKFPEVMARVVDGMARAGLKLV